MTVKITPTIKKFIDFCTAYPQFASAEVSEPDAGMLEEIYSHYAEKPNTYLFTFSCVDPDTKKTGDIRVVIPEDCYADIDNCYMKEIDFAGDAAKWVAWINTTDTEYVTRDPVLYVDLENKQAVQLRGQSIMPITPTEGVAELVSELKAVKGVKEVFVYKLLDSKLLETLATDDAVRIVCALVDVPDDVHHVQVMNTVYNAGNVAIIDLPVTIAEDHDVHVKLVAGIEHNIKNPEADIVSS